MFGIFVLYQIFVYQFNNKCIINFLANRFIKIVNLGNLIDVTATIVCSLAGLHDSVLKITGSQYRDQTWFSMH